MEFEEPALADLNLFMSHERSYYTATSNGLPPQPSLTESVDADVCVVGGGIAGCSAALQLAQRGYRVVLLEAQRVGWGASGRSGGQALVGYARDHSKIVADVGPAVGRTLWDLSVEAVDLLRDLVTTHRIECDLQSGHLLAAIKPRQRDDLLQWHEMLERNYDYHDTRVLERAEIGNILATDRYIAGLLDTRALHLHPLNYTLGLARAALKAGVKIHETSPALSLLRDGTEGVRTPHGEVRSRYTVLCCNAYLDGLVPQLSHRIMPVGTYMIATQTLDPARIEQLIRDNIAVADSNFVLDYFRRSADHRLLFGGRVSYSGIDFADTAAATRKRMIKVFPQLGDVEVEFSWGGYVDITITRAPDFGRLNPHLYYLQGFSGHGIALAGLAGKLAAEAISGHAERFDVYAHLKHRNFFGGTALRTPALMLAMLWFRLRDLL